ncbi:MAG: NAD-binding protein [Verrucomicrobiales bacterium]|nr:NAD-binding protein [Verrucomicrobiales bacterium]
MNHPRFRIYGIALGMALIAVFGASLHGFAEHFRLVGKEKTTLDLFYLTGQLFAMNSGGVDGPVPWTLEFARFLAPLIPASAVVVALWTVFSDGVRLWLLRFRRGHTIVCGLGRKGGRLVEELCRSGDRVVVIEPDEHNPGLARCRELKVIILSGRADDQFNLRRACVHAARRLIATAGDDSINIETAVRAHALVQSRDRNLEALHCVAHVTDPTLQQLLKSHHLFGDRTDPFDLELVNVYEAGARVMLERAGILGFPGGISNPIRVCVVGLGHFGEAVLRRLLRDWSIGSATSKAAGEPNPGLEVIIVDREAGAKEVSVRQRFRDFLAGVTLHFVTRDVRAPDFAATELAVSRPDQKIDALFVCFDDDSLATIAALRIRERFGAGIPIVVRMTEETGFASLMESGGGPLSGLRPIGFLDIACMRDLFLGGDTEIIARAFHETYLAERLAAGDSPEKNSAAVPWAQLAEADRVSSRERAKALRDQLDRVGLALIPCPDRPIALHVFTPEPLEALAQVEHERWLANKRTEGWKYGPERDNTKKLNPFLVAWEALPESEKEFNRVTVRRLPAILARADFEIRKVLAE